MTTNPNGYNCGFVIIKCSNIIKNFIKDFKKYYILFEKSLYDQGTTGVLLRSKKYKNIIKVLPSNIQGNPYINIKEFKYNEDKNFLCHFYGNNDKTQEIEEFLKILQNNKWYTKPSDKKIAILGNGQLGSELYESISNIYYSKIFSYP
jgi:hypothetical protein